MMSLIIKSFNQCAQASLTLFFVAAVCFVSTIPVSASENAKKQTAKVEIIKGVTQRQVLAAVVYTISSYNEWAIIKAEERFCETHISWKGFESTITFTIHDTEVILEQESTSNGRYEDNPHWVKTFAAVLKRRLALEARKNR